MAQTKKKWHGGRVSKWQGINTLQLCNLATLQLLICYRLDGLPGSLPPAKAYKYSKLRKFWALVFA